MIYKTKSCPALIQVCFYNFGDTDYSITAGDKICQLIINPTKQVLVLEVMDDTETKRTGGFGSTNAKKMKPAIDL